jgi:hypothetical protein
MTKVFLTVEEQAGKIEEDCERAAIRDALVSARWHRWNLRLGLASTITAAAAGFLAGSGADLLKIASWADSKLFIAFLALLSAVLASTLTFLAPSEKANAYQQTSNKYHALRERIRFFRNSRCADGGKGLETELESIITEKLKIDVDHPILPEWAYRKTHAKIKEKIVRNQELKDLRTSKALKADRRDS